MKYTTRERIWSVGSYLAFMATLALTAACSRPPRSGDREMSSLFAGIDSLRAEGRYEEALKMAGRAEIRAAQPGSRQWQSDEARRLRETLSRITSLPAESRLEIAVADSMTRVIRRLMDVDENFIAAADLASRQLEFRSRHFGGDHPDVAASLDVLGQIAHRSGEIAQSAEYFERALAIRRARLGSQHPQVAETLNHWGVLYKEQFDEANAEACQGEALSILQSAVPPDDLALAPVLQSLGSLYRAQHHFDRAERLYSKALRIRRQHLGPRSVPVAENLLWLGHSQLCAGKIGVAEKSMTEARAIFFEHQMNLSHPMGDVAWFLGMASWLRDDHAGALRFWRETFACRTNVAVNHPQGYGLGQLRGLSGEFIDALLCEGKEREAWAEFSAGSGPVVESLLKFAVARRSRKGDSDTIDSLRTEVVAMRRRLTTLDESSSGPLRVRLARVDAERMVLEQDLVSRVSDMPGDSVTVERIQSVLKPDQAMVGWIRGVWSWGNGRAQKLSIWGFVLRREGGVKWVHICVWRKKPELIAWSGDFTRFNRMIVRSSQWPHRVSRDSDLDALASNIAGKIFSPLMPHLDGVRELIVVDGRSSSIGAMGVFPECLVDGQGVPLNERFAFSYTPSPWMYVHLAESSRGRVPIQERSLIAVADPFAGEAGAAPAGDELASLEATGPTLVDPTLLRSVISGDREALGRLPRLPFSRMEVMRLASIFRKANVLMGPEASESSLEEAIREPGVGVIHLATHAFIDVIKPGRSALVLYRPGEDGNGSAADSGGDGLITAEEVLLGWKLDADLVTLSGCQTSRGYVARGGEDLGFVQAFFAVGARSLLISRWKVDDRATALFMGRFYENLTGSYAESRAGVVGLPMSKAHSLQEAQIWLRDLKDESGRTPFAHPAYWAGFALMGNAD